MYCASCGAGREDGARFCKNCGRAFDGPSLGADIRAGAQHPHVPNYLVQAILVTIFCCLPFGIVSIVHAAQVNGKVEAGDIDGARRSSASAKMWAWISFGTGLTAAFPVIYLGLWRLLLNL